MCSSDLLEMAGRLQLLKVGRITVAVDGTKVLANASKHSAVSCQRAGEMIQQLELEVGQLLEKAGKADSTPLQDGLTIPDEIDTIAAHERLAKYIDMPLQHADRNVLARMKRGSSGDAFLKLLERMRVTMPDISIRTSFIVGFPGETERDFEATLALVQQIEQHKPVYPSSRAIAVCQNRVEEKALFDRLGIPTPAYRVVESAEQLQAAATELGCPVVAKSVTEGYDGKGQAVLRAPEQAQEIGRAHV